MSDKGWIKLNRSIQDNWIYSDKPFSKFQAWIDLIFLANYENKKAPCNGNIVTCKRGDVNLSISYLAKRWGWGRDKTRHYLMLLEQDNMIQLKATTHRTTITLVNYGKYQNPPTTNKATNTTTNKATNKATNRTQLKNIKNNKENKEEAAPISSENEDEVEMWNGKLIKELTSEEWVEYINSSEVSE